MQRRTLLTTTLAALLGTIGLASPTWAQDNWPSKTIRFVVPYPPGGPTDLMARLLQGELSKSPTAHREAETAKAHRG